MNLRIFILATAFICLKIFAVDSAELYEYANEKYSPATAALKNYTNEEEKAIFQHRLDCSKFAVPFQYLCSVLKDGELVYKTDCYFVCKKVHNAKGSCQDNFYSEYTRQTNSFSKTCGCNGVGQRFPDVPPALSDEAAFEILKMVCPILGSKNDKIDSSSCDAHCKCVHGAIKGKCKYSRSDLTKPKSCECKYNRK